MRLRRILPIWRDVTPVDPLRRFSRLALVAGSLTPMLRFSAVFLKILLRDEIPGVALVAGSWPDATSFLTDFTDRSSCWAISFIVRISWAILNLMGRGLFNAIQIYAKNQTYGIEIVGYGGGYLVTRWLSLRHMPKAVIQRRCVRAIESGSCQEDGSPKNLRSGLQSPLRRVMRQTFRF